MVLRNGEKMLSSKFDKFDKTKVFELIGSTFRSPIASRKVKTGQMKKPHAKYVSLPTSYRWFDKEANETVELRYAQTEDVATNSAGVAVKNYLPRKVIFIDGIVRCTPQNADLFFWLKNSPNFQDDFGKNPNPKFALINPEKMATMSKDKQIKRFEALSMILGPTAQQMYDQRRIYSVLFPGQDVDSMTNDQVTTALADMAEKDPEKFLSKINSARIDVESLVTTALHKGILAWGSAKDRIFWGNEINAESAGRIITKVPAGRNEFDFIVEFLLRNDNSGVLDELQLQMDGRAKVKKEEKIIPPQVAARKDDIAKAEPGIVLPEMTRDALELKAIEIKAASKNGISKIPTERLRGRIIARIEEIKRASLTQEVRDTHDTVVDKGVEKVLV